MSRRVEDESDGDASGIISIACRYPIPFREIRYTSAALLLATVHSFVDGLYLSNSWQLRRFAGYSCPSREWLVRVGQLLDGSEGELAFVGDDSCLAEVAFDLWAVEEAAEEGISECVVGGQAGLVDALLQVEAFLAFAVESCPSQHITAINESSMHNLGGSAGHHLAVRSLLSLALYLSWLSSFASSQGASSSTILACSCSQPAWLLAWILLIVYFTNSLSLLNISSLSSCLLRILSIFSTKLILIGSSSALLPLRLRSRTSDLLPLTCRQTDELKPD